MVLIKTFTYSYETTNSIGVLEANDIDYHLEDSIVSNTFDYLGAGANGIKLYVSEVDAQKARDLFLEHGLLKKDDLNLPTFSLKNYLKIALIIIVFLMILLVILK
jgi:hypothetical protein